MSLCILFAAVISACGGTSGDVRVNDVAARVSVNSASIQAAQHSSGDEPTTSSVRGASSEATLGLGAARAVLSSSRDIEIAQVANGGAGGGSGLSGSGGGLSGGGALLVALSRKFAGRWERLTRAFWTLAAVRARILSS